MKFNDLAYPHTFEINGKTYKGARKKPANRIRIPYSIAPEVRTGDVIKHRMGTEDLMFKVIDIDFQEGGSMREISKHRNIETCSR